MLYNDSQGATFNEIVYEYDKKHSQQLVYVVLSRVSHIEGLYIVIEKNQSYILSQRKRIYIRH
jgi:hypothetical protein